MQISTYFLVASSYLSPAYLSNLLIQVFNLLPLLQPARKSSRNSLFSHAFLEAICFLSVKFLLSFLCSKLAFKSVFNELFLLEAFGEDWPCSFSGAHHSLSEVPLQCHLIPLCILISQEPSWCNIYLPPNSSISCQDIFRPETCVSLLIANILQCLLGEGTGNRLL